jgi:ABC-type molybdate transport system substrate-binding protein
MLAVAVAMLGGAANAQLATVHLYAAGSLRDALSEVARQYEAQGGAKVALTFGASGLLRELPNFKVIQVPADLQVGASYGLGVRAGDDAAQQLARYILSTPAQEVLRRHGFGAP